MLDSVLAPLLQGFSEGLRLFAAILLAPLQVAWRFVRHDGAQPYRANR